MKEKIFNFVIYTTIVLAATWLLLIGTKAITFSTTNGHSMMPTMQGGEKTIILNDNLIQLKRGDIVSVNTPEGVRVAKRIIGLPGEIVEFNDKQVIINGKILEESYANYDMIGLSKEERERKESVNITYKETIITLEDGEYFIMGDNRLASNDSRAYGPVTNENINGKIIYYR